ALRVTRRARAASQRAQALQQDLAVAEDELIALSERERLAQDVHDVMAHSLAVIAAQADGARMLDVDLPARTHDTLITIADTARDGLTELRRLLDSAPDTASTPRPKLAD